MSPDENAFGSPIRRSPIAGTWYPGQPHILSQTIRELIEGNEPIEESGELVGLISPHAGLRYSGPIAAAGYRLLEKSRFDTAVLVGPSHYEHFTGASVFSRGRFETPLGCIGVDEGLATAIEDRASEIRFIVEAHDREHCLEMQVPFLQVLNSGISIVPIVIGDQRRENVESIAQAIAGGVSETSKRVLLVASSDLSHYKSAELAARMDGKVSRFVEDFDDRGLMDLLEDDHEHACGGGPVVAVMMAAKILGATKARLMRYGDSGDVTGDKLQVVGYLSAAMFR